MNLPGSGIVKGMAVTALNLAGSWFSKERLVTEQYPEERPTLPENARNFPFLVFDGADPEAGMRCVACKICEKECPPQCIYIVSDRDAAGKLLKRPAVFDIDVSVCMSCQICVEVCPFDAIRMDTAYEFAAQDRFGPLLLDKGRLLKPNEYYRSIHPTDAAETDARREAAAAKKKAPAPTAPRADPKPGEPEAPARP
jgi:NADH-quinone oxidoreductase subunit I